MPRSFRNLAARIARLTDEFALGLNSASGLGGGAPLRLQLSSAGGCNEESEDTVYIDQEMLDQKTLDLWRKNLRGIADPDTGALSNRITESLDSMVNRQAMAWTIAEKQSPSGWQESLATCLAEHADKFIRHHIQFTEAGLTPADCYGVLELSVGNVKPSVTKDKSSFGFEVDLDATVRHGHGHGTVRPVVTTGKTTSALKVQLFMPTRHSEENL